jgi:ribonuclease HI
MRERKRAYRLDSPEFLGRALGSALAMCTCTGKGISNLSPYKDTKLYIRDLKSPWRHEWKKNKFCTKGDSQSAFS